ncbi:hypothetical protein CANARDRAFT_29031 [[Candida] arabinofermentans NRRL YB-2248]|uniref:SAGA-associated factor 11 n=1 Tax=[Candida] arabinofermentans NRRL YB-2248 TaxID=983967 RepID=A0A1E4SYE6_9ASCO|nr:hypothetical protein CANARDRAFT_29031 [[Candida] arabinofermentans NRRL YB-2248]
MMPENLTYSQLSASILEGMITEITHEIISKWILTTKTIKSQYGYNAYSSSSSGSSSVTLTEIATLPYNGNGSLGNSRDGSGYNTGSNTGTPQPDQVRLNGIGQGQGHSNESVNGNGISINGGTDLYFKCLNCDRKISGNRFAAHIDKCLGGRTRK